MSMSTLMRNARDTARVLKSDLGEYVANRRREEVELPAQERQLVERLRADGYVVVPGYWPRDRAFEVRDKLETYLEAGESRDYESGAYLRFRENVAYDEGVRRLYHADKEVPELAEHRRDPMIHRVLEAYYGTPYHSGVLMFQHNTKSNGTTRYYHVDAFSKEFKSFLYLDDVDEGNGPFAYLPGTHKAHLRRIVKQVREGSGATGFSPEELSRAAAHEARLVGEAGTLILADVRGFHRGTPQLERSRSVLVNYFYESPDEVQLER